MDLLWKVEAFQSFWEVCTSLFISGTSTLETQSVSQPIWDLIAVLRISGSSVGNQEHFALTVGFLSFFCDPWKYFAVSSSLSLWDLNHVSPFAERLWKLDSQ